MQATVLITNDNYGVLLVDTFHGMPTRASDLVLTSPQGDDDVIYCADSSSGG